MTLHRMMVVYTEPKEDPDDAYEEIHWRYVERIPDVRLHPVMQASTLLEDTAGISLAGVAVRYEPDGKVEAIIVRIDRRTLTEPLWLRVSQYGRDDGEPFEVCRAGRFCWIGVDAAGRVIEPEHTLRHATWQAVHMGQCE